jgi:hypothetical protein
MKEMSIKDGFMFGCGFWIAGFIFTIAVFALTILGSSLFMGTLAGLAGALSQ